MAAKPILFHRAIAPARGPRTGQVTSKSRALSTPAAWSLLVVLSSWPTPAFAQGTIVFHNTGGNTPVISESRSLFLDSGLQQPYLVFDFGFATDETASPGSFLDSFTVTLQDGSQKFAAVYLTADATGIAWAPQTPGALFVDSASILSVPRLYPNLGQVFASQKAFEVTAPIPAQFLGGTVTVFFDLFDNQDSKISQGWFSNLGVASIPEPSGLAVLALGVAVWQVRRRKP